MVIYESMYLLFLILHFVVTFQDINGTQLSNEVATMLKFAADKSGSVATSAPIALLDWYDRDQEMILVLERPIPCEDLFDYTATKGCSLQEEEAKVSC